ncbi:MAG: hypothetical protein Q4D29_10200 [Lachnospiraceae bacterium]|nr:hypothetical protein [Lachnospiraceae bacterium]
MSEIMQLFSQYSLIEIIAFVLLFYIGAKWLLGQVSELKAKFDTYRKEYHKEQQQIESKDADIERRLEELEKNMKKDYERIQKSESHLYQIESNMKDLKEIILNTRIQSLRKQILDFTDKAVDITNANISRESYAEIARVYEEYVDLLKQCGKENGLIDYSYRCILHSLETRESNKLFLEDFYISPATSIQRIKENNTLPHGGESGITV